MDPEAWFNLAIQMDQNHATNEAFQASHHMTNAHAPIHSCGQVILQECKMSDVKL
jgi:hypothetical protein